MNTNLAERRRREPEETAEERRQRIWMLYQQRKAMRRMIRFCSSFICGAAFVLAIITGCANMTDAAVVTSGVCLICGVTGVCL